MMLLLDLIYLKQGLVPCGTILVCCVCAKYISLYGVVRCGCIESILYSVLRAEGRPLTVK